MSTSDYDNAAVDPDTGLPLGVADGEGEAADPADLGPAPDPDDPGIPDDDAFFHAPEPAGEDSAMSITDDDAATGEAGDVSGS